MSEITSIILTPHHTDILSEIHRRSSVYLSCVPKPTQDVEHDILYLIDHGLVDARIKGHMHDPMLSLSSIGQYALGCHSDTLPAYHPPIRPELADTDIGGLLWSSILTYAEFSERPHTGEALIQSAIQSMPKDLERHLHRILAYPTYQIPSILRGMIDEFYGAGCLARRVLPDRPCGYSRMPPITFTHHP